MTKQLQPPTTNHKMKNTVTTTYITGRQYDPPGPDAREQELVITYSPWSGCEFEDMEESLELVAVHMEDATRGITYDLLVMKGDCQPRKIGRATLDAYDNFRLA